MSSGRARATHNSNNNNKQRETMMMRHGYEQRASDYAITMYRHITAVSLF